MSDDTVDKARAWDAVNRANVRKDARIAELLAKCAEKDAALAGIRGDAYQQIRDGTGEANKLAHRIWDIADAALDSDGSGYAAVIEAARELRPYTDRLVDFTSTTTEHPLNGIIKRFDEAVDALGDG